VTLELAIKQALEQAAPDLDGLEVEGIEPPSQADPAPGPALAPAWVEIDRLDLLPVGSLAAADVAGCPLVVANVGGTLLAYADRCAGCDAPLHDGRLADRALQCPSCERTFFLPRAGRSMDGDRLQLDPVPLLRDNGSVKVALPA
jgi:nitrite reductase/ring-hydroxylating ferredoxin subunit